ncbi:MAG: hypothetical protein ACRCV9_03480 [Burkholderiaceae bacterium]
MATISLEEAYGAPTPGAVGFVSIDEVYGAQTPQKTAAQAKNSRGIGAELLRQTALTGRYAGEALGQTLDFWSSPIRMAQDKLISLATGKDFKSTPLAQSTSRAMDAVSFPQPETGMERVAGDTTRTMGAVLGGGGLAAALQKSVSPVAAQIIAPLTQRFGLQTAAAAGAGAAGGAVKEGGGGFGAQFGASLLGGLLAPSALSGARAMAGGIAAVPRRVANAIVPQSDELTVKTLRDTFGRSGVDWDALGAKVKAQLVQDAKDAVETGRPLDAAALKRLADFRNVGARPTVAELTQDPIALTKTKNLTKTLANSSLRVGAARELPDLQASSTKAVLDTLGGLTRSSLDDVATGQSLISPLLAKDASMSAQTSAAYRAARDAAGRDIPLDRAAFINSAYANLAKANKAAFLPAEVQKFLNQISTGSARFNGQTYETPFDVNTIDNLKTILSNAAMSKDGNVRSAVGIVRQALDNTGVAPIKAQFAGGVTTPAQASAMRTADALPEQALAAFDNARNLSKTQFRWRESRSFIEDALSGARPEDFVKRHVINSSKDGEELAALMAETGAVRPPRLPAPGGSASGLLQIEGAAAPANTALKDAVRKQVIDYVMKRGSVEDGINKFSQKGLNDALLQIGDRKLAVLFSPDELAQIKSAANVAKYIQAQPAGSAVNNSNTGAMLAGRGLSAIGTAGGFVPLLSLFSQPVKDVGLNLQARGMLTPRNALIAPVPQNQPADGPLASGLLAILAAQQAQDY